MGGSPSGKMYNTPEEAEEFVKTTISDHSVVLFTKRFSPYCYKATSSFKKLNVSFEEVMLSGRSDCQTIQDVLLKMTGARTVPRVFLHGKCIGGGNETKAFYVDGKLKEMVENKENTGAEANVQNVAAETNVQNVEKEESTAAETNVQNVEKEESTAAETNVQNVEKEEGAAAETNVQNVENEENTAAEASVQNVEDSQTAE